MVKTIILLGIKENRPVWHTSTGLAKNMEVARWLFSYLGWPSQGVDFPDVVTYYEVIDHKVDDNYLFIDEIDTLWVLGSAMLLN